ncbi:MAG: hypothetical protein J6Q54_03740 [Oscillospiraceae bacterium]|nr:hypothetical protein [Oscillospiraceae bacterium]
MKKLIAILLILTLVLGLVACTADTQKTPETTAAAGEKLSFTVTVVHADKTEKTFEYQAEPGKLGAFLEAENLIIGSGDGMFHTVDGEKADWNENQSYWAFYVDGTYAMKGIYDTDMEAGKVYKLEYTIG